MFVATARQSSLGEGFGRRERDKTGVASGGRWGRIGNKNDPKFSNLAAPNPPTMTLLHHRKADNETAPSLSPRRLNALPPLVSTDKPLPVVSFSLPQTFSCSLPPLFLPLRVRVSLRLLSHHDVFVDTDNVRKSVVQVVLLRPPLRAQPARDRAVVTHCVAEPARPRHDTTRELRVRV